MRIAAAASLVLLLPLGTFAQAQSPPPRATNGGSTIIAGLPEFVKIYPGAQVFHNARDADGWGINYRSSASVAELTRFYEDLEQRSNVPLHTESPFGMDFGEKGSPRSLMVLISDKGEWRSVGLYFKWDQTKGH